MLELIKKVHRSSGQILETILKVIYSTGAQLGFRQDGCKLGYKIEPYHKRYSKLIFLISKSVSC